MKSKMKHNVEYRIHLRESATMFEHYHRRGGLGLVCLTPDRVVQVRGLAGDIVVCSWARHFTLTVPLSTQVYQWVPV